MVFLWFSYKIPPVFPQTSPGAAARIAQAPRSKASAKSRRPSCDEKATAGAGSGRRWKVHGGEAMAGHGAPKNSNGTGTADLEPNAHHRIKMNQSIVGGFNESKFIKSYHGYDLVCKNSDV
jgi:hypothetical protein